MPAKSAPSGRKKRTMAERSDVHVLYEAAVQCVEAEIDFVDDTYRKLRGRKARLLREDFAGTANTSCEWVHRRKTNRAIAVDLDPDVQEWGREYHLAKLPAEARDRVQLINANVLEVDCEPVDIVLAMNFSYWIFKSRDLLRQYFKSVHDGLVDDGLFMLDAYGGSAAYREMGERSRKEKERFTYIWEQKSYNPVNGDYLCQIHFNFPDGSRIREAFTYDWRLWTLPEIREILIEAGFERATVYWEGTDEDTNEGNGEFTPTEQGEADDVFIVYIVAEKQNPDRTLLAPLRRRLHPGAPPGIA